MKPRFHLIGLAIVLMVLWRLHSLGMPSDLESLEPSASASVDAVSVDAPEERPTDSQASASYTETPPDTASQSASLATFMGKPCPESDCAVDLDGYHWAEEHGINDPGACPDPSGEFFAGCRLYAGIEQRYNI